MASSRRNVLGIGFSTQSKFDPREDVLDKQRELASTKNLDLTFWLIDAMNEPHETVLAFLKQKLEERDYAAISIGFGIRGNRDLTPLFEKLVNAAIEVRPGTKLAFSTLPDDVVDACLRVLN